MNTDQNDSQVIKNAVPKPENEADNIRETIDNAKKTFVNQMDLPTEDEFNEEINRVKKTALGRILPILSSEVPRVLLGFFAYMFMTFTYSFMRQFKDFPINNDVGPKAFNWLKVLVFLCSIKVVGVTSYLFANYEPLEGLGVYLAGSSVIMGVYCVLYLIMHFLFPGVQGWAEYVSVSASFEIRNLNVIKVPLLLVNYFYHTIFYLICEVIGSTLMTVVFPSFVVFIMPGHFYKRYFRAFTVASNLALVVSAKLIKWISGGTKLVCHKNYIYLYFKVFFALAILYGVIYLFAVALKKLVSKPLYVTTGAQSAQPIKKKKKSPFGILTVFKLMGKSKLLAAMCLMSLAYNMSSNINSNMSKFCYNAYTSYMEQNPDQSYIKGRVPSQNEVSAKFSSFESVLVGLVSAFVVVNPLIPFLFEKLGVISFGLIPPIMSFAAALSMVFWASLNFSAVGDKKVLWGITIPFKKEYNLSAECSFIALFI